MTNSERIHLDKVARLGCIVCRRLGLGVTPAQVHHIRTGQGMGQRASDYETIPLCPHHHTGPAGVHGMGRKAWEREFWTEVDMLKEVLDLILEDR